MNTILQLAEEHLSTFANDISQYDLSCMFSELVSALNQEELIDSCNGPQT